MNHLPKIPLLVATASILQISESLLPHPIPGLRFGFANIITLIILVQYGFKPALTVTLLRTVVSSFILGTFLSPGFILSFMAGLAGILTAGVLQWISCRSSLFRMSPVGLSMAGAFVHNMVQIYLAYLLLITLPEIFFLVPFLSVGAVVTGAFSGGIASRIMEQLILKKEVVYQEIQPDQAYKNRIYQPGDSLLHKCPPEIKFSLILGVTVLVVLKENLLLYGALFACILILIRTGGLMYRITFRIIKRIWVIILSSFLLPLYFNPGTRIFIETDIFTLHHEAVVTATVIAARIILLALLSSLMAQTTRTREFTRGIGTFLKPFDRIGLDSADIARTISLSMVSLPAVWHEITGVIRFLLQGKKKNLKTLKNVVIQIFIYIFTKQTGRP